MLPAQMTSLERTGGASLSSPTRSRGLTLVRGFRVCGLKGQGTRKVREQSLGIRAASSQSAALYKKTQDLRVRRSAKVNNEDLRV